MRLEGRRRTPGPLPGHHRSALLAPLLGGALVLLSSSAQAHAPPLATGIVWQSDPERVVVRTNRGLVVSSDGGVTFSLLCNEALGVDVSETPALAKTTVGTLLMATSTEGLLQSSPDLCDWTSTGGPAVGLRASDVTGSAAAPESHFLVIADPASTDSIFAGTGNGTSWQPIAPTGDVAYTRLRVAPLDAQRLYRAGVGYVPATGRFHQVSVSPDGGATWTDYDVSLLPDELQLFLLEVDPNDSDTVYARTQATSSGLPERLLVSRDAGQNFSPVLTTTDLLGFAIDRASGTVWAGGADGLWRSTDGGATFDAVPSPLSRITCLAVHDGSLYACAIASDAFGVSVSADDGASFAPYLVFSDVASPLGCASGTRGGDLCDAPFQDWERELLVSQPDAGGGAGSASGAGGTGALGPTPTPTAGAPSDSGGQGQGGVGGFGSAPPSGGDGGEARGDASGCSCETRSSASSTWRLLGLVVLAVGSMRRRAARAPARLSP